MTQKHYIHPQNPQAREVLRAAKTLQEGSLVALPTRAGYVLCSTLSNKGALKKSAHLCYLPADNHTLLCRDLSTAGSLVNIDNTAFHTMKQSADDTRVFILPAPSALPSFLRHAKHKTVGVRIPQHAMAQALLAETDGVLVGNLIANPANNNAGSAGFEYAEEVADYVENVADIVWLEPEPVFAWPKFLLQQASEFVPL